MNKNLLIKVLLLVTAVCTVLFFVGCDGDNSISTTVPPRISPTTNPFAGSWKITFDRSPGGRVGGGTITIASSGFLSGDIVFMGNAHRVTGIVSYSGDVHGRPLGNGGFSGKLSGNSGSGQWAVGFGGPGGTWSARRR